LSFANLRDAFLIEADLAHATLTGAALRGVMLAGARGIESVQVDWIDIGEEGTPERLQGELAHRWLQEEAAKLLPEWWKK
jgi:hypothetical protein